jgi:hypothetical protein
VKATERLEDLGIDGKTNNIEMVTNEMEREIWAGSTGLMIGSSGIFLRT